MYADRCMAPIRSFVTWVLVVSCLIGFVAVDRALADEYAQFLTAFVVEEGVDYKKALTEGGARLLDVYIAKLVDLDPSALQGEKGMALLINAYNACTLKLVLDHYPLRSIKEIDDPWDQEIWKIAGKEYSLGEIEKDLLLGRFGDARIHFALNCASKGCPPLAPVPYTAKGLRTSLDERVRLFLNDPAYNRFEVVQDGGESTLEMDLARLLLWHRKDFKRTFEGFEEMLIQYADPKFRSYLISEKYSISHSEYDWTLNDVRPFRVEPIREMGKQ